MAFTAQLNGQTLYRTPDLDNHHGVGQAWILPNVQKTNAYNPQGQVFYGSPETGFTPARTREDDGSQGDPIYDMGNMLDAQGRPIYGTKGRSDESNGAQIGGSMMTNPNYVAALQRAGITPKYDPESGWVISGTDFNRANDIYMQSIGGGIYGNQGNGVDKFLDSGAPVRMMMAAVGGLGGAAPATTAGATEVGAGAGASGSPFFDQAAINFSGPGTTNIMDPTLFTGAASTDAGWTNGYNVPSSDTSWQNADTGAAGAGGAIADQVPFSSLINSGTMYIGEGGVGGPMAGADATGIVPGDAYMPGLLAGSDAATTGLIQQLANFTGLSTDAVTRLGSAAISSLAGMYGAGKLSQASLSAANRLATANQGATALQTQMYNDQVARQQPFYQAGLNALPAYSQGVMPGGSLVKPFAAADFQADPGYAFRVSEGLKALDRTAASRGGLLSGATLKGAENYNQNMASNEYNNAYNRYVSDQATQRNALAGLTGFAPTAAQQISNAGTNYATNVNNLSTNTATNYANADLTGATARQSAYTGAGGAFANALTPNPLNAYLNKQLGLA